MEKNIPQHVAIIMDGNGRWATMRHKKRSMGHLEGSKNLELLALYAFNLGIKYLSVYAFSTDNFKRSDEEVNYLMDLFIKMFKTKLNRLIDYQVKIVFSGRTSHLRDDVKEAMQYISNKTKDNDKGVLNICLNYGGQEELIDATIKVADELNKGHITKDDIKRENFYKYLYQDLPPIDLLIRTGGEYRVSNFMLYQMSYAEFYFTDCLFPDFKEPEFEKAIAEYQNRNRRYGKV